MSISKSLKLDSGIVTLIHQVFGLLFLPELEFSANNILAFK
jgi:hypothetical protein